MLFLLNRQKVPSIAVIIQVTAPAAPKPAAVAFKLLAQKSPLEQDADIHAREKQPPIVVGVTPTCPYGISSCWGGAYLALGKMQGVRLVRPVPNGEDSTGSVYLKHDGLPDLDVWPAQFGHIANGTHIFRGVEMTVEGVLQSHSGDNLIIDGDDMRPPLALQPITAADKIQWDFTKGAVKPLEPGEQEAYTRLVEEVVKSGGSLNASVTGPLKKSGAAYVLEVRQFNVVEHTSTHP